MNINFRGNADAAKQKLPIAKTIAQNFADRTLKRGFRQDALHIELSDEVLLDVVYCFGITTVTLTGVYSEPDSKQKKKIVEHKKIWNQVMEGVLCSSGNLGAFTVFDGAIIPFYKGEYIQYSYGTILDTASTFFDETYHEGEFPRNFQLKYFYSIHSKSLAKLYTVPHGGEIGERNSIWAENFDIVLEHSDSYSAFNAGPSAQIKGGILRFAKGGDFQDSSVPEIIQSTPADAAINYPSFSPSGWCDTYFWINAAFGVSHEPVVYYRDARYFAGDEIYAFLSGTNTIGALYETYNGKNYYEVFYNIDIVIKVLYGELVYTHTTTLISHFFRRNDALCILDNGDNFTIGDQWYPACVATTLYCAKRNTVFVTTILPAGSLVWYSIILTANTHSISFPEKTPFHHAGNIFHVKDGALYKGTTTEEIFISNILGWNYSCTRFLYKNTTLNYTDTDPGMVVQHPADNEDGTVSVYELRIEDEVVVLDSIFTFSGISNDTYFYHSKEWETIVVKGATTGDGIYRYNNSTHSYDQLQDGFTDQEPVYISYDGTVVATKTMIYGGALTIPAVECVGVFWDHLHFVDKLSTGEFAIKDFTGKVLKLTPPGLYNFYELSDDSSLAVISKCVHTSDENKTASWILLVNFADGPLEFEECDRVGLREITFTPTPAGSRYWNDLNNWSYIEPSWGIKVASPTGNDILKLQHKAVITPYSERMETRLTEAGILQKQLIKTFYHKVFGIFERITDVRGKVSEDLLTTEITYEV
jgi:hypothetical protein